MFWKIRLMYWMWRLNYSSLRHLRKNAAMDCWSDYREGGYSPKEAIFEDLSYL